MLTEVLQKLRTLSYDERVSETALATQVRALVSPLSPEARASVVMELADWIDAEARSCAEKIESARGQVGATVSHHHADNAVTNAAIARIQRIILLINIAA